MATGQVFSESSVQCQAEPVKPLDDVLLDSDLAAKTKLPKAVGMGYVQLLTRAHNRKLTITRFLYIVDVTTITTILQNENVAVNALARN